MLQNQISDMLALLSFRHNGKSRARQSQGGLGNALRKGQRAHRQEAREAGSAGLYVSRPAPTCPDILRSRRATTRFAPCVPKGDQPLTCIWNV